MLRAGDHQAVVVDSGPDPQAMRRCLDELGVREVPLLVLSHFHADHVDGLAGVFAGRTVARVWVSPLASPAGEAATARDLAARQGVPVEVPEVDRAATVGEVALRVLGPVPPQGSDGDQSATENDASLVLLADVDGLRVLLTGDVEPPGQRALLSRGTDLRAQVLKIPHHGSARQEAAFFAATGATVAIASAGVDNDYGHPAPKTVALAQSLGMTVLRTDQNGSVAITWTDGRLGAVTQRRP
ncbi:ComEC/Rec2 family competence protein [uncultured Friedmanniella sp.]|uniref:ComEC/Rec2 family competence protein n=1 Tax=uncultured Friedmanniella sp. TaxID=335381 RepID=UPI0035C9CF7B